jgi:hypothetical protein
MSFKIPRLISLSLMAFIYLPSCITPIEDNESYGLAPNKEGYIPARIALINCLVWPERSTRIRGIPESNLPAAESQRLCIEFDQFVAAGFDNQPYMKGLSPKLVDRMYAAYNQNKDIRSAITEQWLHSSEDCQTCTTAPAFYLKSIAARKSWRVWLSDFSKATKGADAVLMPFLLYQSTSRENERGLIAAKRAASVALILIDTSTGELIWSGGREASVATKAYEDAPSATNLAPPDQNDLKSRLLSDAVWVGFPGRKIYK